MSRAIGADVRLKLETLQPTFSYKVRGAFNAVLRLAESGVSRSTTTLVTASAGNHGRALAVAAATVNIPLTVYAAESAPRTKLEAIRDAGAILRTWPTYDDAEREAKKVAAETGALYISPYNHPDVIAGAGTVGLEIVEDWPDVDTIVVPIGGGGLISGIALAAGGAAKTVGVEAEASAPFTAALAAGRIIEIDVRPTLADGLAGNLDPDAITFDIVREHVTEIVRVTEQELADAIAGVVGNERLVVEGAGATAVAGGLSGRVSSRGRRIAIVLSGANIDAGKLAALLQR